MAIYRVSRNIEASIIQYIEQELASGGWTNIAVEKTFSRIYDIPIDTFQKQGAVCVRLEDTDHQQAEIGETSTRRFPFALIDIFAASDGQRLDLKDFLIEVLKKGLPFFEYEVNGSTIVNKTQNGRIRVSNIDDTLVNLGIDRSLLTVHDRYRHLLTLELSLGRVEV
jgi:hypothetical protein